jgi:hypothetical protein
MRLEDNLESGRVKTLQLPAYRGELPGLPLSLLTAVLAPIDSHIAPAEPIQVTCRAEIHFLVDPKERPIRNTSVNAPVPVSLAPRVNTQKSLQRNEKQVGG